MPTGETPTVAPTIVLVEDDDDTRASLVEILEDHGYRVVPFGNGRDAQSYLLSSPTPNCLVLDLWMPVMDGWALAALVKEGRLPEVPMMVITAAEPYWGYPVHPRYVMRKPLDSGRFLGMVGALVAA
jgi:CheY-like chemotaxis protein